MTCSFCQIASGEKREEILLSTDRFIVFAPHTRAAEKLLVVPRTHYSSLEEIPLDEMGAWLMEARKLAAQLGATRYKMQINVGSEHSTTSHIYMQFSYSDRKAAPQERVQCRQGSTSTGAPTQHHETTARALSAAPLLQRRRSP